MFEIIPVSSKIQVKKPSDLTENFFNQLDLIRVFTKNDNGIVAEKESKQITVVSGILGETILLLSLVYFYINYSEIGNSRKSQLLPPEYQTFAISSFTYGFIVLFIGFLLIGLYIVFLFTSKKRIKQNKPVSSILSNEGSNLNQEKYYEPIPSKKFVLSQGETNTSKIAYCIECGYKFDVFRNFCPNCGVNISK